MRYVDLSVVVNQHMPVYPGDPATKVEPVGVLERDGWVDHYLSMGTHAGTHIDAPAHMIAGGATLDRMPVERFIGRGRLVRASDGFDLKELEASDVQAGDVVLFDTGTSDLYPDPAYLSAHPAMPDNVASYLVDRRVTMVGVDACSVDRDELVAHKILLGGNVLIVENLANLRQLDGKGFIVYALPIKVQLDGGPARVIALIDE